MAQLEFDENTAKLLEVLYNTRDVLRRRALVKDSLHAIEGERILDVGCGPGFYVAELLQTVGPTGSLVGVDSSPQMLAIAQHRTEGRGSVAFHEAEATSLPFEEGEFDVVLCVQVLEYVADVASALTEMRRVLLPGGRVLVWDVDWSTVSWRSSDDARMERVLQAWDQHLAHRSLPRTLGAQLRSAGFDDVRMEGHLFATSELTPDAYGGAIVPLIAQFAAGRNSVTEEDAKAWEADLRELNERGEYFFACLQFCFTGVRWR